MLEEDVTRRWRPALRPKDLAERWDCSERHVRNLCNTNSLRHFRLGAKLVRIPLDAVEEYECGIAQSSDSDCVSIAESSPPNGMKKAADTAARRAQMTVVSPNNG